MTSLAELLDSDAHLDNVEVRREWEKIDLLIIFKSPALAIVVENKVDAAPYNPLDAYRARVQKWFPDHQSFCVVLSPRSDFATHTWVSYSYQSLLSVLQRIPDTHGGELAEDVSAFLEHYRRLIRSRFMVDSQTVSACKRIYKQHRTAIDLIIKHGRGADWLDAVEEQMRSGSVWQVLKNRRRQSECLVLARRLERLTAAHLPDEEGREVRVDHLPDLRAAKGHHPAALLVQNTDKTICAQTIERLASLGFTKPKRPDSPRSVAVYRQRIDHWKAGKEPTARACWGSSRNASMNLICFSPRLATPCTRSSTNGRSHSPRPTFSDRCPDGSPRGSP